MSDDGLMPVPIRFAQKLSLAALACGLLRRMAWP